jgi:RimJ/RimL family protein N-acetyltransferase
VIETERLLLRKPTLDDDASEFVRDDAVQRWLGGGGDESPRDVLERWVQRWDRNGIGQFIVELDGRFIGRVGFVVWDARTWETSAYDVAGAHAETELGWAILSHEWGHGYAVEAARAALDWARDRGRIISLIEPRNVRSSRVADKLGATPEQLVQTEHGPTLVWVHAT